MDFLTSSTHLHITTWVVGLILFFVAAFAAKPNKPVHMILRVMYILIIITGGALFFEYSSIDAMNYGIKFVLGLLVIGMMEMILVKKAKQQSTKVFWILFVVFFAAILFYGFKLPLGFDFFA